MSLNLVEVSPHLSKMQKELLCSPEETDTTKTNTDPNNPSNAFQHGITPNSKFPVTWYKDIRDVPKEFTFYVAHEFFDALPIHKLQVEYLYKY